MRSATSTVDDAEVARFSAHGRRMVGPARQDGAAAQVQSGALAYIRDRRPSASAATPRGSIASKGLRILDIGCGGGILSRAAGAARRRGGRRRSGGGQYRGRQAHAEQSASSRSTIAADRRGACRAGEQFDLVLAMEVVEHVADVPLFVATLRLDGEARRADDRGDAQPHAQELCARHRRRRIRAALAAASARIAGTSSSRRTSSSSPWSRQRAARHRRAAA